MPNKPKAKKIGPFKWVVEVEISPTWVEDGFDLTDERAQEIFHRELSWARGDEVTARVIKAPKREHIKEVQGYTKGRTGPIKVVALDEKDLCIVEQAGEVYNSRETPEEFGFHMLRPAEIRMIERVRAERKAAKASAATTPAVSPS